MQKDQLARRSKGDDMPPATLAPPKPAGETIVSVAEAKSPIVRAGATYWQSLCGENPFPSRAALTLRGMARFVAHAVIVRVVDGGADYEYRFVGDAQISAFKVPLKGIRVSQVIALLPELGAAVRIAYDRVLSAAAPFVIRGAVPMVIPDRNSSYHETAMLPLGENGIVDHILVVGVLMPEPFWDIAEDYIDGLAKRLTAPAL
jgi:hypothetical protein